MVFSISLVTEEQQGEEKHFSTKETKTRTNTLGSNF